MSTSPLSKTIELLPEVSSHKSFVFYRLPNQKATFFLLGDAKKIASWAGVLGNQGFAFVPAVNSHRHSSYLIIPDEEHTLTDLQNLPMPKGNWPFNKQWPVAVSQEGYLHQAMQMVAALQSGSLGKVILSRVKKVETSEFNPWETYQKLCAAYPSVMVYWVSIPGEGTWMGATPETLLRIEQGLAETVALAGTQPQSPAPLPETAWGIKEQEEQRIVSDDIEALIGRYFPAVAVSIDGPKTVSTGALLHLKTTFTWRVPNDVSALEAFITALHPTPAIVGQPREAALDLIAQTETHDRAYYTGLLGPVSGYQGLTHLFVNLRCMQVLNGSLALYLGGGLTAASTPEAEWQETELKAATLLSPLGIS